MCCREVRADRSPESMSCKPQRRRQKASKHVDSQPKGMSARKTQSALLHSVVPEACARHGECWQALKAPCWLLCASSCRTAHRQELRDGWEADPLRVDAGPHGYDATEDVYCKFTLRELPGFSPRCSALLLSAASGSTIKRVCESSAAEQLCWQGVWHMHHSQQ